MIISEGLAFKKKIETRERENSLSASAEIKAKKVGSKKGALALSEMISM